jgi:uncharacterized tellurite resistance protein B-like protein
MQPYARNSPQAAARILALAMLADGRMCKAEIDTFDRLRAHEQLDLQRDEWHAVVDRLCEDLLTGARRRGADACEVDPAVLSGLMAEVDDPELRMKVLRLCVSVMKADRQIAPAESIVLVAAVDRWGLHPDVLPLEATQPRRPYG